jgi:hypothetical protein
LLAAAAADDAEAELDVELAAVLELEEEQAARASTDAPASPAVRRIEKRRWVRIMGQSLHRPGVRELSGS